MWFQGFQKHGKGRGQEQRQEQDVHSLNQVARFDPVTPGYPQDLSTRRVIDFVYLPHDEVLILASMDGQYPCWVSQTGVHDIETNTAVADAVLFDDFSTFTSLFPRLDSLTRDRYRRRFYLSGTDIKTPFDYGFSSEPDQIKYWGQHVARGISGHYLRIKELCTYRELDGRYLAFLKSYLTMLEARSDDAVADYEGRRTLIKLLTDEDYLYVSDDEAIRNTYVRIRHEIGDLYNSYMTIVR